MKQKITIITSNDKDLEEVLKENKVDINKFNEASKKAWDILISMLTKNTTFENNDKIYIESVETLE